MEKVDELISTLDTLRMRSEALYESGLDESTKLSVLRFIYQLVELELSTHRLQQSERRMRNARSIAIYGIIAAGVTVMGVIVNFAR